MSTHDQSHSEKKECSLFGSRAGLVLIGFFVIVGALLFTEHRAHVFGWLIWLPLLACPLLHLFMHGGHGKHAQHNQGSKS